MPFELNIETIEQLKAAIQSDNQSFVKTSVSELHPADIAEIINELDLQEARYLYKLLDEETAADVVVEMDEDTREQLLASFTSKEIAETVENLESDEAADVIGELSDEKQDEVLSHIEDSEQASDIVDLLNYDENTAGGLMAKELVKVNVNNTMLDCVRELREHADHIDEIYTIYVVDDDDKLKGLIALKKVLTTSLRAKIIDVMNTEVITVKTNTDAEDVAKTMEKYDLVYVPVVDGLGRLVGRITIDDVVDVIRKEETEDVQKMAGMEALEDSYMSTSVWAMLKKRSSWLVILFIGEGFTATAMSFFEDEIAKAVVLALFVPLIISSGGNTGSQVSSLIIRALSLGEITIRDWWTIFKREIKIGLMLGIILGTIGFLRVAIWSGFVDVYGPHWLLVGITVGVSLIGVVLWGNIIGSIFPILLKRFGLDPAVSSAPFVATLVDITGLIIYFSVSMILLRGVLL